MRHRIVLGLSFLGTQLIMLWALLGPILDQPWLRGFRGYFANDQLSYAAIARNAANGLFSPVEPLTETGASHYPSAWYQFLGFTSALTGLPVFQVWTILGLIAISGTLAFIGFLGYRFSHLAFAPLLPGLVLLTGTFSTLTSQNWFTALGSHAVIWGPFGTLFTLNAEAIGLAAVTVSMGLLVLAGTQARRQDTWIFIAAAILGALANVQTYTFLTGVSLAMFFLAAYTLLRHPSRTRLMATAACGGVLLATGTWIADAIGPLPLFVLLMATTLPAISPVIAQHRRTAMLTVVIFGVTASPQVIRTLLGLATGDEFLAYRQASSLDLSVDPGDALIAAIPLLLIAGFTALALLGSRARTDISRHQTFSALLIALAVGAIIMASNDRWGFNQEPYRFWLQYSIIALLLLSVTTAWALRTWPSLTKPWQRATALVALAAVLAWIGTLTDVFTFRAFANERGVLVIDDERGRILQQIVEREGGLTLSSRCLDPQLLKLTTGAPVVWFNRGLAWPENRTLLDPLMDPNRSAALTLDDLVPANITRIVTDTACADEWRFADARIQPKEVAPYEAGTITVWRVLPAAG